MGSKSRALAIGLAVVGGVTLFRPAQSRADVIVTFDLSGTFANGQIAGVPLSGSVTVDTTTGVVQSEAVKASFALPTTFTQGYDSTAKAYFINVTDSLADADIFFDTSSLVNYAGGKLGSMANPTAGDSTSLFNGQLLPPNIPLQSGVATPEAVPEPGSTTLLLAGLGSLALISQLRRAR